jgi:hypothetical protein
MPAEAVRPGRSLEPEERERLFTHGLHEENIFYNRLNVFLVCESLLFAAVVSALSGESRPERPVLALMCVVGVLVSLLWWVAQANKLALYKTLVARARRELDEFRDTLETNQREGWKGVLQNCSGSTMLAHAFPVLFTAAWSVLLLVSW